LACFFDPVDLGEDISEDICEWKDDSSAIEGKRSDIDEFDTRDIGDDERGDEKSGDNVEHEKKL
jgi:hypothetical protein